MDDEEVVPFWLAKAVIPKVPSGEGGCGYTLEDTLVTPADTLKKGEDVNDIIWYEEVKGRSPDLYKLTSQTQTLSVATLVQLDRAISLTFVPSTKTCKLAQADKKRILGHAE